MGKRYEELRQQYKLQFHGIDLRLQVLSRYQAGAKPQGWALCIVLHDHIPGRQCNSSSQSDNRQFCSTPDIASNIVTASQSCR